MKKTQNYKIYDVWHKSIHGRSTQGITTYAKNKKQVLEQMPDFKRDVLAVGGKLSDIIITDITNRYFN